MDTITTDRRDTDTSAAPRLSLVERAEHTDERNRDCRTCKAFVPAPGGMGYGWCRAFDMYVKLYHPPGGFYSQCQFQVLTRVVDER